MDDYRTFICDNADKNNRHFRAFSFDKLQSRKSQAGTQVQIPYFQIPNFRLSKDLRSLQHRGDEALPLRVAGANSNLKHSMLY